MGRATGWISMLEDSRRRTLEVTAGLPATPPVMSIINPPVWEIGHVAWFQEKWNFRRKGEPSLRDDADRLWDSFQVVHDTRWELNLPDLDQTLRYAAEVLFRLCEKLGRQEPSGEDEYFLWLAIMHEDMHGEAFTYTRQTLGCSAPPGVRPLDAAVEPCPPGDVEVEGGEFEMGAPPGARLVFDNEKWAHPVRLAPFRMARAPVTQGQYLEYVESGGPAPVYWVNENGKYYYRDFDQVRPLNPELPILHVSFEEAEAFCRWAGRRLPTEAEWEFAASGPGQLDYPWGIDAPDRKRARLDGGGLLSIHTLAAGASRHGLRHMIGNVWEWTSTEFAPYPGFVVDPYREYSQPWFTPDYRVLRGGCWATRSRLIRNTWRNFYTKDRRDVFAGFRTCAIA